MHTRVTLGLIAAVLGIAAASPAVLAKGSPGGGQGGSTGISCPPLATQCTVSAGSPGSPGGSGSGGGSTTVTCTWQPLTTITPGDWILPFVPYGQQTTPEETGQYYLVTCSPALDGFGGGFKGSAHGLGEWRMIAATRRCHGGVSAIHGVREG